MKTLYKEIQDGTIEGYISLADKKILDEEVKYLAEALKSEHCKVTSVNLKSNKIVYEGAKELMSAIDYRITQERELVDIKESTLSPYISFVKDIDIEDALIDDIAYEYIKSNINSRHIQKILLNNVDLVSHTIAQYHTQWYWTDFSRQIFANFVSLVTIGFKRHLLSNHGKHSLVFGIQC